MWGERKRGEGRGASSRQPRAAGASGSRTQGVPELPSPGQADGVCVGGGYAPPPASRALPGQGLGLQPGQRLPQTGGPRQTRQLWGSPGSRYVRQRAQASREEASPERMSLCSNCRQ